MSKRVAVYARVSTTRQAENDISIPDQLAHARRFCEGKKWYVVREFVDAGASARDDKRPQFQSLMDAACLDPSPFDVVLVHSQSRFFRDAAGYVFAKRRLQKHGVSLVSMTQGFGEGATADFAETILAAADQYNSAETAKHVSRTMLENARQGFWNGAPPPFGYRTVAVEQRGQRVKKHLEVEPKEAEIVRRIFKLFLDGDGTKGPMGIKAVASWLNARGIKNGRGNPFYTSEVHKILKRESYSGVHYYNRCDSRTGRGRPKEEWVAVPVPKIVSSKMFRRVQDVLNQRRPTVTPPRVTNSAVLLTGLARCEGCGGPLMIRTGKGGRYRYYACAGKSLRGGTACSMPITVPEAELDRLVIGSLAEHLLTPDRLPALLREAQRHRKALASGSAQRSLTLRKQLKEAETQIDRLHTAVAEGTVSDTSMLRDKLDSLNVRREECVQLLRQLDSEAPPLRHALSNRQANSIAAALKRRLIEAPAMLQRRYVRGLVSQIVVDREKVRISGSKATLAAAVTSSALPDAVRSSVREWRALGESNPSFNLERVVS